MADALTPAETRRTNPTVVQGDASRPGGPRGARVTCAACDMPLDALRAGHVAIFNDALRFFCTYGGCRARFFGAAEQPERDLEREAAEARRAEITCHVVGSLRTPEPVSEREIPEAVRVSDRSELLEPLTDPVMAADPEPPLSDRREVGLLLVALALIAGLLTMALELADATGLVAAARLVLLIVGTCALLGRALTVPSESALPRRFVVALGPALATVIVGCALVLGSAELSRASFLAGTVLTVHAITIWLVGLPQRAATDWRDRVADALAVAARRLSQEAAPSAKELSYDVRPGEHVVVEMDQTVGVDLEVTDGEAEVLPWIGATTSVRRRTGDVVVAGARVVKGQLRGTCTWTHDDRSLARPSLNEARRPDVQAALARHGRRLAERWAIVVAVIAGGIAALTGAAIIEAAMIGVAVCAAIGNVATGSIAGLAIARGIRTSLARGIVYNGAAAWEACAQTTAAVFCARGTLLRGEPEMVETAVFGRGTAGAATPDDVLALAAGALAQERSPVSLALRRAAHSRALSPDPVRNPRSFAGRGVTAVASTGEALCVGSRALMLERHISVAVAESAMVELESHGRIAFLVARAGRLVGLVALQDGLRAGARAAVQHLLDARIEPILMSADARETCEALGRSLDVDHLRPEVLDADRAKEVRRIRETGARVAVIGHTPHDGAALSAAAASVAMAAAGRAHDDFSASLVSDDVRDAALALALAHRTHQEGLAALLLVVAPAALGSLIVTLRLLPPEYAPLALLLGVVAAVWQDRSRRTAGAR